MNSQVYTLYSIVKTIIGTLLKQKWLQAKTQYPIMQIRKTVVLKNVDYK